MEIFHPPKRFDNFPIPLENSWAWDSDFWEYIAEKNIPQLSDYDMHLAKESLNNQLARVEHLLIHEAKSEREISFQKLPKVDQFVRLLERLLIERDRLNNQAIRSKPNLEGMKQIIITLIKEIEKLQRIRTRQLNNEIPCYYEFSEKMKRIINDTKQQIQQITNSLFEEEFEEDTKS